MANAIPAQAASAASASAAAAHAIVTALRRNLTETISPPPSSFVCQR
jgi:hypothetical protein